MNKKCIISTGLILALCLNFSTCNFVFAKKHFKTLSDLTTYESPTKYPDYATIFVGKDKFERYNRSVFNFNLKLNNYVLRPINTVWASVMPKYGMERLDNAYKNIEYPIRLFSCLFQKDFKSSKVETERFFINTTLGLGGMYDNAKKIFKLEPKDEDMSQALASHHIKQGPYLVIPIIAYGNVRDLVGKILDCPFNPTMYVAGPIAAIAKVAFTINKTAQAQPLMKSITTTYADSYDVTKKLYGIDKYIKNENLDRKEVLAQHSLPQNIMNIRQVVTPPELNTDIKLKNYNSQGALIDAMRTVLFNDSELSKSMWSELSLWNRTFGKRLRTASVQVDSKKPPYKFHFILQKDKTAPLAIIYPSIGENISSEHAVVLGKMLYEKGYSILIQGSAFQWEFVKSMPNGYHPGVPANDAKYLRLTTAKILDKLNKKYLIHPKKKILTGTSFGALTALFTAAQEAQENTLNISNYIVVSPPVDIFFALKQCDKFSLEPQSAPTGIKMRTAVTAEKVLQMLQKKSVCSKQAVADNLKISQGEIPVNFDFTEDETELIMSFIMKQKLSDVVFALEKKDIKSKDDTKTKMKDFYYEINNMSFTDYAKKYLPINNKTDKELSDELGLYSIAEFLKTHDNFKIYHAVNDYYTNPEQLSWLKKLTGNKTVLLDNGSHLGFMYRKEFKDSFLSDIDNLLKDNTKNEIRVKYLK